MLRHLRLQVGRSEKLEIRKGCENSFTFLRAAMLKLTPAWQFGIALKMFEKTFCHKSTGRSQGSSSLIWPSGGWRRVSEIRHFICKVTPSHQDTRIEEGECVGLMLMLNTGANFR